MRDVLCGEFPSPLLREEGCATAALAGACALPRPAQDRRPGHGPPRRLRRPRPPLRPAAIFRDPRPRPRPHPHPHAHAHAHPHLPRLRRVPG
ncbi:hypothetical protein ACFVJ8_28320 [Streptomyces yangpuensis]|uniref:hypothetical protein n=1 Tax=Streptomyces yangpuensis TaxID=1648182 RepID=UPI003633D0A5